MVGCFRKTQDLIQEIFQVNLHKIFQLQCHYICERVTDKDYGKCDSNLYDNRTWHKTATDTKYANEPKEEDNGDIVNIGTGTDKKPNWYHPCLTCFHMMTVSRQLKMGWCLTADKRNRTMAVIILSFVLSPKPGLLCEQKPNQVVGWPSPKAGPS